MQSFLAVILSAILFSLGIPNEYCYFGSAILGFSGLVLLYVALSQSNTYKKTSLLYAFFVCTVHVMSSFWLAFFQGFAIFTLGASTVAYFFLALPFGYYMHHAFKRSKKIRMFVFASIWLMWEFFKSNGFLAYPWGTAPMICFNLKVFIQFIDITGVWGLSFIVPLITSFLGEMLCTYITEKFFFKSFFQNFIRSLLFIVLILLLINLYGFYILNLDIKPKTYLNAVIVQQNGDPWDISTFEDNIKKAQDLSRNAIVQSGKKADIIVWSESSLSLPYEHNQEVYNYIPENDPFIPFLHEVQTPIIVGSTYIDGAKAYNCAYLLSFTGSILGKYAKTQLVPFAEYMPFSEYPFVAAFFTKIVGFASQVYPGKNYCSFSLNNSSGVSITAATPICFEDAFPTVCLTLHNKGSEVLINITNDSWSKTKSAEYQHFVISYFRAIELRTSFIRSTNSGYSVVVDPKGFILGQLPLFEEASMLVEVPIYGNTKTIYAVLKNWFPLLIFIVLIKLIFNDWINNLRTEISRPLPSCHWEMKIHQYKKMIRRYKPRFSCKRKKSKI